MSGSKPLGQVCYEGYSERAGGKSLVSGDRLPGWDDLPAEIRQAWEAAATAAVRADLPADVEYRG